MLLRQPRCRRGFTLVELLVVIGVVVVLISILLPAINKARKQANTVVCLSNLRTIGQTWNVYVAENAGAFPYLFWYHGSVSPDADINWHGNWMGILSELGLQVSRLICPEAPDDGSGTAAAHTGFGDAFNAWNGKYNTAGTPFRFLGPGGAAAVLYVGGALVPNCYRIGSYGFNNHTTALSNWGTPVLGSGRWGNKVSRLRMSSRVPMVVDADFPQIEVYNWAGETASTNPNPGTPIPPSGDVHGVAAYNSGAMQAWRFLLARHGRGINMLMVDGSAQWVPLEDVYEYYWDNDPTQLGNGGWTPYRLNGLPSGP